MTVSARTTRASRARSRARTSRGSRTPPETSSPSCRTAEPVVAIDDVRALALSLPRTTEAIVRGRVKFRVGQIVYVSFSHDERVMGFAFPKEEREWLVGTEPEKFVIPAES